MLDPSQSLRAKRDIGIRYALSKPSRPTYRRLAPRGFLMITGKLVTPGLVDPPFTTPCRTASCCPRPRGQAARSHLRRRARGRSFHYTVARTGAPAGRRAGHDLQRHPRGLRQFARNAVPDQGDVEVPRPRLASRGRRSPCDGRAAEVIARVPGWALCTSVRRGRRRSWTARGPVLRRHAQQHADGPAPSAAGPHGRRGRAVRAAV